jgi:hypothetical protein
MIERFQCYSTPLKAYLRSLVYITELWVYASVITLPVLYPAFGGQSFYLDNDEVLVFHTTQDYVSLLEQAIPLGSFMKH